MDITLTVKDFSFVERNFFEGKGLLRAENDVRLAFALSHGLGDDRLQILPPDAAGRVCTFKWPCGEAPPANAMLLVMAFAKTETYMGEGAEVFCGSHHYPLQRLLAGEVFETRLVDAFAKASRPREADCWQKATVRWWLRVEMPPVRPVAG